MNYLIAWVWFISSFTLALQGKYFLACIFILQSLFLLVVYYGDKLTN